MSARGWAAAGLVALLTLGATALVAGPAEARTKFSSCEDMHRVYSNGVAKNAAAANLAVSTGNRRPIIAPRVYKNSSPSLDSDKDGTMCEVKRY